MAAFPLSPHYAKMLCLSKDRSLLQYMLFIISAMSVQEYLPVLQIPCSTSLNNWGIAPFTKLGFTF
ncbi:putative ATP-dependent RNA helicase kurz [Aphis craccivora]|uniref:Putative ATP-dependent RNA helicase kurz n=1 Tax=Aphis craccivora TaxID=307492 RepID=A0A6G0Y5M9_APHCR|nr:putative ATP-dependent RNA helicase kurz [Aphis craccivora]